MTSLFANTAGSDESSDEAPRVIPCLLLDDDRLVKTVQFADAAYVGDPVNVLSLFNSFEVDEMILLDISAVHSRTPSDLARLRHFAEECFIPLAYGGGVTTLLQVEQVLAAGYEKVVLNTALAELPELVQEASRVFGSQAIVGSIDVRGGSSGEVFVNGATRGVGEGPVAWAKRAEALGVGEILVTAIDREGTMSGFDLELIEAVASVVGVPVIAHGGAGKRKDLSGPIHQASASAVAAGSLFVFQGPNRGVLINYPTRSQLVRLMHR
ncbi:MAG: HisA/HisF-related TIM barrel protein [Aquihabitans sp.]